MTIPFTEFYQRLLNATDIRTQMDLANALGVHRSAITQAKLRDSVPQKWILALARHYTLSPDWLEYGAQTAKKQSQSGVSNPSQEDEYTPAGYGQPVSHQALGAGKKATHHLFPAQQQNSVKQQAAVLPTEPFPQKRLAGSIITPVHAPELVYVPKVRARLCAGSGSFEIEAVPVAEHPFPRQWLARMGSPSSMVFMDVIGDSMSPAIFDGDMVLVDQAGVRIVPHDIYAVGVEDSIYIKRVEQRRDGIILHSDNPNYSDMELYGDELETFRVIGKVVWLCRDIRQ